MTPAGCSWKDRTTPRGRALVLLGALAAAGALCGYAFLSGEHAHNDTVLSQALKQGYGASTLTPSASKDEDPDVSAAEVDAGFMWARSNKPMRAAGCPTFSAAFRKGCAGYVAGSDRR